MIAISDLFYALGGGLLLFVLCYLYRRNKIAHKQKFAEQLIEKNKEPIEISAGLKNTKIDPTLAELGFHTMEPILGESNVTPSNQTTTKPRSSTVRTVDIISLNVFAMPEHNFAGYELLQALLAANLRFGEMSIFHRYQEDIEKPKILFSVASATEPGTFDLNAMGSYSCTGLTLFMRTDQTTEPQKVFDMMLATAKQLAEDLSGEIYDAEHEPFTKDSLLRYQELLVD